MRSPVQSSTACLPKNLQWFFFTASNDFPVAYSVDRVDMSVVDRIVQPRPTAHWLKSIHRTGLDQPVLNTETETGFPTLNIERTRTDLAGIFKHLLRDVRHFKLAVGVPSIVEFSEMTRNVTQIFRNRVEYVQEMMMNPLKLFEQNDNDKSGQDKRPSVGNDANTEINEKDDMDGVGFIKEQVGSVIR